MGKRSFELFEMELGLLPMFGAIKADNGVPFECKLSYENSLMLRRIRKRNTVFFDQLTKIVKAPYDMSDVRMDFLYDAILVNFSFLADEKSSYIATGDEELVAVDNLKLMELLYFKGFTITGVPKREEKTGLRPVNKENSPETENVHYRAFVASASMARKGQLLFVNEKYDKELMERLTLGFYSRDENEHRLIMPTRETVKEEEAYFQKDFKVPAAKFFAYLGLTLSDGVSMEEQSCAWKEEYKKAAELPMLNEETVFVARDWKLPAREYYEALGDYAWVIEPEKNLLPKKNRLQWFFEKFPSGQPAEDEDQGAAVDRWRVCVTQELKKPPEELAYDGMLSETVLLESNRFGYIWAMALLCRRDGKQGERAQGGELSQALEKLFAELKENKEETWNTLKNLFDDRERFCIAVDGDGKSTATHGGQSICFGFETADSKTYCAKLRHTSELTTSFSMFDGIGLCDNETFDQLERMLLHREEREKKRRVSAVIIRLPWLKGVLVRCDFMGFFKEKAGEALQDKKIKDIFGCKRRLEDIHIIITDSMLKGCKYLKNLHKAGKPLDDPWAYYWEKVNESGISLLITGKNSPEHRTERINYQFLSTAGLSDRTAEELCCETAASVMEDLKGLKLTIQDEEDGEDDAAPDIPVDAPAEDDEAEKVNVSDAPDEGREQQERSIESFQALMDAADEQTKKKLRQTKYVQTTAQACARTRLLDAMKGRLEVAGDYRFVAPDLMAMLYYLFDAYIKEEKAPKLNSTLNTTDKTCKGHGYYYAPGERTPWGEKDALATLRNPHYALGEAAIVYPVPDAQRKEYDKWFGELTSVIMLPATAVSTMGGADFDGDRCLCLADRRILDEIKANMKQNVQRLTDMAHHRDSYSKLLTGISEGEGTPNVRKQAKELKAWLANEDYIPRIEQGKEPRFRKECCPPLIFGDDSSHSLDFSCTDPEIEKKLYRSFLLTTGQRIGILSLLALQYSDKAYQVNPAAELTQPDSKQWSTGEYTNLQGWLWHWRMVSLALECGVEIDMAKTGVRCVPAALRENTPIPAGKLQPHQVQLHELFHNNANLLGTFRKLEKLSGPGGTMRQLLGKKLAKTLLERLLSWDDPGGSNLLSRSEAAMQRPHNNVGLLPYRMYRAMLACMTPEEALQKSIAEMEQEKLALPFPEPGGKSIRDFFRDRLGILEITTENSQTADSPMDDSRTAGKQPITMETLVWETGDRAGKISDYLRHYIPGKAAGQMQMPEVADQEQGVYFLKEVAKLLHYARLARISNSGETSITPQALAGQLREIWPDARKRLAYLCQYQKKLYDELRSENKTIMSDQLFLELVGKDFSKVLHAREGEKMKCELEHDLCKAADEAVMHYAIGRLRRANHAESRIRMEERYRYCLRNLQRRYSLAHALQTLAGYTVEYQQTPLGKLGVAQDKLHRVFGDMEG